jgi:predicted dehydrogenase
METIRIGIIGCGIIAGHHMENYLKVKNGTVVAICDIDESKLASFGDKYGISRRFTSIDELLTQSDIDAVDVCLHNNLHAPVSIEAMKRGKDVYCEKPMAGSWADAKEMHDTARVTGRKLHIQLSFLYVDEAKAAQRIIQSGRLGRIYHMRSYGFRRRGRPYVDGYATKEFVHSTTSAGGALFDMGVYHISQLLYLAGLPTLERVSGRTYAEVDMDPVRREISGFDVEELGCGFAHYSGNITMDVLESWAIHMGPFPGSMIAGSLGGLCLDPLSFHTTIDDIEMDGKFDLGAMHYRNETVHRDRESMYADSQSHWVAALRGECPLLPTASIALETQLLQEGIHLSAALDREVTADEIRAASRSKALVLSNLTRT